MAKQAEEIWRSEAAKLATETAQGRLIVAEKSGHNIMLEQPDVVIEAIRTIVEPVRGE
jgi:pimeloyl-ACP methyl ester carboxylesterase